MFVSIICPLYKGEKFVEKLNTSILKQKNIQNIEIIYIVTETELDGTVEKLEGINATYKKINQDEFSHSLTREEAIYNANGEIVVLITQDIIIENDMWLYNLIQDIDLNNCEAAFSRQICDNKTIERYTRINNYPKMSRIVSKDDVDRLGTMTYFYSDAASAIKRDIFVKLNGYDSKDLITNEDMYIAYKLISNGYRIKYCAESQVVHSHNYSYKSLIKRYFDQGVFLRQHPEINSSSNQSAMSMVKSVIKNCIRDRNYKVIFGLIPNFAVRFIGNKLGQSYQKLPKSIVLKLTANRQYWTKNK